MVYWCVGLSPSKAASVLLAVSQALSTWMWYMVCISLSLIESAVAYAYPHFLVHAQLIPF